MDMGISGEFKCHQGVFRTCYRDGSFINSSFLVCISLPVIEGNWNGFETGMEDFKTGLVIHGHAQLAIGAPHKKQVQMEEAGRVQCCLCFYSNLCLGAKTWLITSLFVLWIKTRLKRRKKKDVYRTFRAKGRGKTIGLTWEKSWFFIPLHPWTCRLLKWSSPTFSPPLSFSLPLTLTRESWHYL